MKTRILRYLKHISSTLIVLLIISISFCLYHGASASYGHNNKRIDFEGEGPYAFYDSDSIIVKYIRGNKTNGFSVDSKKYYKAEIIPAQCFFPLDSTTFNFNIESKFEIPRSIYEDKEKILAISDIESGYRTFRDFLIYNQVINSNLEWTFEKGHLVLLGDFVDRGFSTMQVLWFINKLEQSAKKHGGQVHFIIGNHELKNMYGDHQASSLKYTFTSSIIGKTQSNLYDNNSFIGRWLASKNSIEYINGHLFAHGGIHSEVVDLHMSLDSINNFLRQSYHLAPYPKKVKKDKDILLSSKKGICWYRGYFKEKLSQKDIEAPLEMYNAKAIIVGHTLHAKVKFHHNRKVISIDVAHPKDYHKNWPSKQSEGLLIQNNGYFRLHANKKMSKL